MSTTIYAQRHILFNRIGGNTCYFGNSLNAASVLYNVFNVYKQSGGKQICLALISSRYKIRAVGQKHGVNAFV